jgi:hypothetical protein
MVDEVVAIGRVEGGKLALRSRDHLAQGIRRMSDGPVVVRVKRKKATRTERQNAYYHAVVVEMIADFTGHDVDEVHEFLKKECNGRHVEIVDKRSGVVREEHVGMSTASLNVNEFYDYVERCRAWAGQFLGLVIPDPIPE